jgi:hypothetical protein
MLPLEDKMAANELGMGVLVELLDMVDMEETLQLTIWESTAMASEMMMVIVVVMAEMVALAETQMAEEVEILLTVQTKPLLA